MLAVSSCDFLEKEPYQLSPENYFNNESEVASFLTSVYAPLASQNFYGNYYMDLNAGDDLSHYGGGRNPATNGTIACNNANSSSPYFSYLWITLYSGIDRACMLLENIDATPDLDETVREQYRAEARFLRAFYYFTLVQGWGDVPFRTTATNSVNNLEIARTDKETIYNFIVTEMAECAEHLKSASDLSYRPGRISKSAAWGILARVYLFRAGEHFRDNMSGDAAAIKECFRQADVYAQKVLNEGHSLAPNYWDVFIDMCSDQYNTTANESIWEVEFAGNYTDEVRAEGRIGNLIGIKCPDQSNETSAIGASDPGFGYAFYWSTPKLYDLYEANGDKERFYWNLAPFEYTELTKGKGVTGRQFESGTLEELKGQYWWNQSYIYGESTADKVGDYERAASSVIRKSRACGKYRREYESQDIKKNKNFTSINFPVLRYSDVLLMVAEAENEVNNGPTSLAYECINQVRERAGIQPLEAGMGVDEFRQAVKDERAMELCFEYTRRYDLIRWGEYVKNMNALVSLAQQGGTWNGGNTYSVWTYFQITDAYNYFPIPDSEISVNSQVTQNPGW